MPTLIVADLTADAFAPYGEVCTPASIQGRRDHVATLDNQRPDAKANLFLARSGVVALPLSVTRMENHPRSSQSFLPFTDTPIVLVVARPGADGQPDLATAKAFLARGQGFSYAGRRLAHRGRRSWHDGAGRGLHVRGRHAAGLCLHRRAGLYRRGGLTLPKLSPWRARRRTRPR